MHLKTVHKGIKSAKCSMCSSKFTRKSGLNSHMKFVHKGIEKKSFNCNICFSSFSTKGDLNSHVRTIHEENRCYK